MSRHLLALAFLLLATALTHAHFVYVVPATDGKSVQVVFSDTLQPDKSVPITKASATKLHLRAGTKRTALKLNKEGNAYQAALASEGAHVVYGRTDYGVLAKGKGKPFLLIYHPKAILGDPFGKEASLGKDAALDILPVRDGDRVKFQVLAAGAPLAGAEVFIREPGADANETVKTDEAGHTPAYNTAGRYAVVARKIEPKSGEDDTKKYEEVRHYATLVVDVPKSK